MSWSDASTPREYATGIFKVHDESNVFQKKTQFRVIALTKPFRYSGPAPSGTNKDVASKYWFVGRILDKKMSHINFLDNPCNTSTTPKNVDTNTLVYLHTKIILSTDNEEPDFTAGDVVIATIEPGGRRVIYGLQFMKFLRVEDRDNKMPEVLEYDCSSLTNADWDNAPTVATTTSPPTSTPPSTTTPTAASTTASLHNVSDANKDKVHVIYWYAGVNHGTKSFVEEQIKTSVTLKDNQLIVVGEHNYTPAAMIESADKILKDNGWTKESESIGGWSAGGQALANHLKEYPVSNFTKVEVVDPVTAALLGVDFGPNTVMYYRVDNWSTTYAQIRAQLPELAAKIRTAGGTAEEILDATTGNHDTLNLKQLQDVVA